MKGQLLRACMRQVNCRMGGARKNSKPENCLRMGCLCKFVSFATGQQSPVCRESVLGGPKSEKPPAIVTCGLCSLGTALLPLFSRELPQNDALQLTEQSQGCCATLAHL